MKNKQSWKILATGILVFLGGMTSIFANFALGGFPFPSEPIPRVAWLELALLLVLLAIPLFR
jgi:hypothetical protein